MTTKARSNNAGELVMQIDTSKIKFTKEQLLTSKQFSESARDIINTILEDGESYSFDEVKQRIEEFKAKEVK